MVLCPSEFMSSSIPLTLSQKLVRLESLKFTESIREEISIREGEVCRSECLRVP